MANNRVEHRYHQAMAIENRIQGLGYKVVSVWGCSHPELSTKQLNRAFIPYLHHIIYDFEAILVKQDLSVTSDLMINSLHILISVVINNSVTRELIFLHNRESEWLIKEFVAELDIQQEIIFDEVVKMYPMVDENSLPPGVQSAWLNWVSQVLVFEFNSGMHDLNKVKYDFDKTISNLSYVNVAKKDNSYMFLITPQFKFLDVRNYLAPGLSYDDWCKANRCEMQKFVFPYE